VLPGSSADTQELLEWIHSLVVVCPSCRLSQSRRNAVPGEGSPTADIIFVGEAPGAAEDAEGRPFVGASGRLLTEMLAEIGLRREDVFIGSIVKCRPPNNREPKDDEIIACNDYLLGQIALIRPRVIATLGKHAGRTLIDPDLVISRVHGTSFLRDGIHYMPLFHPAYALYNQAQRDVLRADMHKLGQLLSDLGVQHNLSLRSAK
jgi:uracil-DNA glycosylase